MKKNKNISKLYVGVFLIAIYCNVLLTQLFCNYSHLINLAGTEREHPHQGHDHHHGNDAVLPIEHSNKNHNDSREDNNCCNDKTSSFFVSQTCPINLSFDFKNTFFKELVSFSNIIYVNNNFSSIDSTYCFPFESPPPKIPDIRVFTHSFLI